MAQIWIGADTKHQAMKFNGYWVTHEGATSVITPTLFDETDLTVSSGWTEAHQNEDEALPRGLTDPARVLAEVAQRLATDLSVASTLGRAQGDQGAMRIESLEDLGRLCLLLAPCFAAQRANGAAKQSGSKEGDVEIPFDSPSKGSSHSGSRTA